MTAMNVSGVWPLDGTAGSSYFAALLRATPANLVIMLRSAMQDYRSLARMVLDGTAKTEVERENIEVLVQSFGSVDMVLAEMGVWEEGGRFWMRDPTYDQADRAFIACAVLSCVSGRSASGEMYSGRSEEIVRCASNVPMGALAQVRADALEAIRALRDVGDLQEGRNQADRQLVFNELSSIERGLSE